MTNKEKNKEKFDELGDVYFSTNEIFHRFAVRKNGEIVLCAHIPCRDCIFGSGIWSCDKEKEIWLESEAAPDVEFEKKYDDLKRRLFTHTANGFLSLQVKIKDQRIAERKSAKYTELFLLISEAGLINEYYEWLRENGYNS